MRAMKLSRGAWLHSLGRLDDELDDRVDVGVVLVAERAVGPIAHDARDLVGVQSLRHVLGAEEHASVDARNCISQRSKG